MASRLIKIEGKTRNELRDKAREFRLKFGIENQLHFDVVKVLESTELHYPDFNYQIVTDDDIKEIAIPLSEDEFSIYDSNNKIAYIRDFIYENAQNNDGFSRMAIIHEISHHIVCKISPIIEKYEETHLIDACYDAEWQAKCLAGEILVPYDLTLSMSVGEIREKCSVTLVAACYQYNKMHNPYGIFCYTC